MIRRLSLGSAGNSLVAALLVASPALAALPPDWQRVREFQSALESAAKTLEGRPIDAVERLDADRFLVRAGPCRLEVAIVRRSRETPGPQIVSAIAGRPSCR